MRSCQLSIKLFLFFLFCTVFISHAAFARVTYLEEVIQEAKEYDGRQLIFRGEVIGDILARRAGVWLNMDDSTECIGIWIPYGIIPKINYVGNYKAKGDIIEVDGIFNRACPIHGGETDIHASKIMVLQEGSLIKHRIMTKKLHWALILAILAIFIACFYCWQRYPLKRGKRI